MAHQKGQRIRNLHAPTVRAVGISLGRHSRLAHSAKEAKQPMSSQFRLQAGKKPGKIRIGYPRHGGRSRSR